MTQRQTKIFRAALMGAMAAVLFVGIGISAYAAALPPGTAAENPLLRRVLFGFGEDKKPVAAAPKEHPIHDDAAFTAQTKAYGMMPYSKAELEFEIFIPKDWTEAEIAQSLQDTSTQSIIGDIAKYTSPMIGTLQVEIVVQALHLEHETTARSNGWSLQSDVTPDGDKIASAYYVSAGLNGAPSTYEYATAHISGSYVLVATFRTPLPLKDYVKYLQKKTIDSFRILYPKEDPIEEQKVFTLVDSIKFDYPASWDVVSSDFRDMNRLSVHLQSKSLSQIIDGFVRFVAIRRNRNTDIREEIEEQKKYFDQVMKLKFLKMLSSGKSPVYDRFMFNRYEVYDVQNLKGTGNVQEIHLLALGDKDWYIFAFLFTPKESTSLETWGRNTQTFQEIMKSIK